MTKRFLARAGLALLLAALAWPALGQTKTYLALGDSLAWGYQPNDTGRGPGDKGYVRRVADWLGTVQGVRPQVLNLGVPGETASSFFDTSEIGALLNSNYPILFRQSQRDTFVARIAGRTVTHVTVALGGNDLLELLTADFLALPFDQQTAIVDQVLVTTDSRLVQVFTLLRQRLPGASVAVPCYYPYGAFPGSAEARISAYAIPRLNQVLANRAKQVFTGPFDTLQAFRGNELAWTWIGEDDIHARDPGYAKIADLAIVRFRTPLARPAGQAIGH
jgi:lysophospholipase L1-like esterase